MMFRAIPVALPIAAAFAVALAAPVPKDSSRAFFPTTLGTKWTYEQDLGGEYTEEITRVEVTDGATTLTVARRGENDDPMAKPNRREVAVSPAGVFSVHGGRTPETKQTCLITFPPKPGDTWKSKWDPSWTCMVVGTEKVKVPTGEYDAIRVDASSGSGRGYTMYSTWYAPGVGVVQMSDNKGRIVLTLKSFTRGKGKE